MGRQTPIILLVIILLALGATSTGIARSLAADAKTGPAETGFLDAATPCVVVAYWETIQGDFLLEDNLSAAWKHYSQAVRFAPEFARAYRGWGACYLALGYPETAVAKLDQGIRLDPHDPIAYQNRAVARGALQQWDDAIADCDKSITINAGRAEAWCERAGLFAGKGDKDQAVADWTHALELDPKHVESLFRRGNCFASLQKLDKAEEDLSKAIEIAPAEARLYFHRGFWRDKRQDYEAAIDDYQKTLKLDAQYAWAHNRLARLFAAAPNDEVRNGEAAVEHARQACELSQWKTSANLAQLAAAYAELGNFEEAIRWQTEAIEVSSHGFGTASAKRVLELYRSNRPLRFQVNEDL